MSNQLIKNNIHKIQFRLSDSPFHKECKKLIKQKCTPNEIMQKLDKTECLQNWDTWEITKDSLKFWDAVYEYSDSREWHLWLAKRMITNIMTSDDSYNIYDLCSYKNIILKYKDVLNEIDWPEPIAHLKNYLINDSSFKSVGLNNDSLEAVTWAYYHQNRPITLSLLKQISHNTPDLGDDVYIELFSNPSIPDPANKKAFLLYVKMFESIANNSMSSQDYPLNKILSSKLHDRLKLAACLGTFSSTIELHVDTFLNPIQHKYVSNLALKYYPSFMDWYNTLDKAQIETILIVLNLEPEDSKLNIFDYFNHEVVDIIKSKKLDSLIDMNNLEDVLAMANTLKFPESKQDYIDPLPTL